jgi:hypothetical protein
VWKKLKDKAIIVRITKGPVAIKLTVAGLGTLILYGIAYGVGIHVGLTDVSPLLHRLWNGAFHEPAPMPPLDAPPVAPPGGNNPFRPSATPPEKEPERERVAREPDPTPPQDRFLAGGNRQERPAPAPPSPSAPPSAAAPGEPSRPPRSPHCVVVSVEWNRSELPARIAVCSLPLRRHDKVKKLLQGQRAVTVPSVPCQAQTVMGETNLSGVPRRNALGAVEQAGTKGGHPARGR